MHSVLGKTSLRVVGAMLRLVCNTQPTFVIALLILVGVQGLIPLANAWVAKSIFDLLATSFTLALSQRVTERFIPLLIIQVVLIVLERAEPSVASYLNSELGRRLDFKIQKDISEKISGFIGVGYFETSKFYDNIRLAMQGAQMGAGESLSGITILLKGGITVLGFMAMLINRNPILAGLLIITALPHLYSSLKLGRQHYGLMVQFSSDERRKSYLSSLISDPPAAKEIRLFNLSGYLVDQMLLVLEKINRTQRLHQLRRLHWEITLGTFSALVSVGGFIAVIIQASNSQISIGDVALYTAAVAGVQASLANIIYTYARLVEHTLLFKHYSALIELAEPLERPQQPRSVEGLRSEIELRNVSFRYTELHPWVLRNVNLTIKAGECIALVGLNGAGKSTIVKLLIRLYDPAEGEILWNGINIKHFNPEDLRERISGVFQDFVQFDLTAQENIGFGNIAYLHDKGRITSAARLANVHDAIMNLPNGYNTSLSRWLADNQQIGAQLSGGEWQKIAIARMFMREADFLILDEPTAALDAVSEYELYSHFAKLVAGRTSLLISHRFSTVRMADAVAVLNNGRITEFGSHDDLMAQNGVYAKLYTLQAQQYGEVSITPAE